MTTQAEVTGISLQAGMIFAIDRAVFLGVGQVEVNNCGAVQCDFDFVAVDQKFLCIPFTNGFEVTAFGGSGSVERTVVLVFLKFGIFICSIIENLNSFPA